MFITLMELSCINIINIIIIIIIVIITIIVILFLLIIVIIITEENTVNLENNSQYNVLNDEKKPSTLTCTVCITFNA